jgi:uncharacterized membrane protein YidH (DUF202 family)
MNQFFMIVAILAGLYVAIGLVYFVKTLTYLYSISENTRDYLMSTIGAVIIGIGWIFLGKVGE